MNNPRQLLSVVLAVLLAISASPAQAEMIGTSSLLAQATQAAQLTQVQSFIARDDVRAQLLALGVDPAQAEQRVAAMTGEELQQVSDRINDLPAGGSVLEVVLVVFLVLILLDLLGVTNIFPRI